ncbi:MAG: pantoate--beta-alanine ligase [Dysgonomonas sp.]|nr:pantoate--beta-alanine ligase [Dysgonomonas sp.]
MKVLYTVSDVRKAVSLIKDESKKTGFVPTMGALHEGHISLVKESVLNNDITIISIFVNPTQFNNKEDLEKYPHTIENDLNLLREAGVDIVFVPAVEEIYPEPDTRQFDFGQLDKVMEGKFRPGHFNGVAQVVSRLFDIVKPDKAYFGEKDFQQLAIIREMVRQYDIPVEIMGMPIKREQSGLAMSSRNQRLTDLERDTAAIIYATLKESKGFVSKNVTETINFVIEKINQSDLLEVEYFEIVDGNSLQPIKNWEETSYAVGCIAVFCGDVRLIDNITYFKNGE